MDHLISYDDANMRLSAAERKSLAKPLAAAHARVEAIRASGEQGFFDLPFASVLDVEKLARALKAKRFTHLVVIGIGGSDLGARTVVHALGGETGMRVTFLSNPDPMTVARVVKDTDWRRTAVNVVSKSGTTLETMSVFGVIADALIKAVGQANYAKHVVATTDPTESSALYRLAHAEGFAVLPHPLTVGGRFSVLSVVGLFPAACAGVPVRALLAGARTVEETRRAEGVASLPARLALNQYASTRNGCGIHVLMPYADALSEFGFWYRQLWAESLGKDGRGATPIAAFGAIDQHSQIQLYTQGPSDKTVTFIEVTTFGRDLRVPKHWSGMDGVGDVAGLSFTDILHAERSGTAHALSMGQRPNGTLTIPRLDGKTLGALFMAFELATVYAAELFEVNAYNQPGVEAGKKEAKRLLSR